MTLLSHLYQRGLLRPLDNALAQTLRRLQPDTHDDVLSAAVLASLAVAQGHSAFDPQQPQQVLNESLPWPPASRWIEALQQSSWVAQPSADEAAAPAPLVWENGLLYLRRYREYERRLAKGLQRLEQAPLEISGDSPVLSPLLALLFPPDRDTQQRRAAELAQHYPLLLISGGPGTGKTSTIARLLLLRMAQYQLSNHALPRIALAAPTGRAAERMAESVRRSIHALNGLDPALIAALPSRGSTIHRLLGVVPDSPDFQHHATNPLPFDIIVIDEASMLDLPLMCKLIEATASGTQCVLLGDPDQLPSVETGDVLRALVQASIDENQLPGALPHPGLMRIHLHQVHRQHQHLHLAPLAQAVRLGDSSQALQLLRDGELSGIRFYESADESHTVVMSLLRSSVQQWWQRLMAAANPAQALHYVNQWRVLTAVREGAQGSQQLNARIRRWLYPATGRQQLITPFHGHLLLITENSYRQGLYNGDIGLCWHHPGEGLRVWFPGDDPDTPRAFHLSALPSYESAFAMTIHKAQGSEFDTVWLMLPEVEQRVLSRELLYTGLTRARQQLHLSARAEILQMTLARHTQRCCGLTWRLQTQADHTNS